MYRITDPARSRGFHEALSLEFRRELPIVRNGELEATTYELGTGYGHIALAVDDRDGTLARLSEEAIKPEREPYRVREGGSRLCFVRDADS